MYLSPDGKYPRFIGDIQIEHPNWKPDDALPEGWHKVNETPMPTVGELEWLEELAPALVNGEYVQTWQVRPMTDAEIEYTLAPKRAKEKLLALGLTEQEVEALVSGRVS